MSCWVVPTIAAEYWGISVDLVMRRMGEGLVPQMTESGFVFVDIDPWATACTGAFRHEPPPTFVSAGESIRSVETACSPAPLSTEPEEESSSQSLTEETEEPDELPVEDDLPDLDEEESATFGRLSWEDVRQQVSRSRRPPPTFRI